MAAWLQDSLLSKILIVQYFSLIRTWSCQIILFENREILIEDKDHFILRASSSRMFDSFCFIAVGIIYVRFSTAIR